MGMAMTNPAISEVRVTLFLGNWFAAQSETILRRYGIKRIISVLEQPSRMPPPELCDRLDLLHGQFRIPDDEFEVEENEPVNEIFPWISDAESQSQPVLIHCHGGVSRSPSLMISYLIWRDGMSFEDALNQVAERHPRTCPRPEILGSFLSCINMELPTSYHEWYSNRRQTLRNALGLI